MATCLGCSPSTEAKAPTTTTTTTTPTTTTPTTTTTGITVPPPAPAPVAPAPVASTTNAASVICEDGHARRPCLFMVKSVCYIDSAAGTNYVVVPCPVPMILTGDACHKVEMCIGVSDEGCCVDCPPIMETSIARSCVDRITRATSCDEVFAARKIRGCIR